MYCLIHGANHRSRKLVIKTCGNYFYCPLAGWKRMYTLATATAVQMARRSSADWRLWREEYAMTGGSGSVFVKGTLAGKGVTP